MAGSSESETIQKHLFPIQILKLEESFSKLQDVIENEYVNPFGIDIGTNKLYNISSGESVDDEVATNIFNIVKIQRIWLDQ